MTPFKIHWLKYQQTNAYKETVEVMIKGGMKQPYIDNILSGAFSEGYNNDSLENSILEFLSFTKRVFTKATTRSSLQKLKEELKELNEALDHDDFIPSHKRLEEYVDCTMCLLDSMHRNGFTVEEFCATFKRVTRRNIGRIWIKNADNTYSHVKK